MRLEYSLFKNHIAYILDFWKDDLDRASGGIHFYKHPFETRASAKDSKCLLMHVRQIYNFAVGYRMGIKYAGEIANSLYESLDKIFECKEGLYCSIARWHDGPFASSYDLFYSVIGLAKYASCFKDKNAYLKAKTLFFKTREVFTKGNYGEDGCYAHYDFEKKDIGYRTGNSMLHHFEALLNLYDTASIIFSGDEIIKEKSELTPIFDESYILFENKLYRKDLAITPDRLEEDFSYGIDGSYGCVTIAHVLEWFGFLYEATLLGYKKAPILESEGKRMVDTTMDRARTPVGAFKNRYYLYERSCSEEAEFWSQPEAILGCLYAYKSFGERAYMEDARRMTEFYFRFFIDETFGGIVSGVTSAGIVIDRAKGHYYKCDHHALRMCEKIIDYKLLG